MDGAIRTCAIIPAYRAARTIGAVVSEARRHVETVVVVDDGSDDGSAEQLSGFGDSRVHAVLKPQRGGQALALNAGIEQARGEWIAFLDDDDLWSPKKLRLQLDAGSSAAVGWVYAAAVVVDEKGGIVAAPPLADAGRIAWTLGRGNVIWGGDSNVVVRTELLRMLGGFDESLLCFEDWDLWIRLARSCRAASCPEVLVATLDHSDRMLFRSRLDVMAQFERMLSKHRQITRRDRLTVVEWLAEEHLRDDRRLQAARLYIGAALRFRSAGNLTAAAGALFG